MVHFKEIMPSENSGYYLTNNIITHLITILAATHELENHKSEDGVVVIYFPKT